MNKQDFYRIAEDRSQLEKFANETVDAIANAQGFDGELIEGTDFTISGDTLTILCAPSLNEGLYKLSNNATDPASYKCYGICKPTLKYGGSYMQIDAIISLGEGFNKYQGGGGKTASSIISTRQASLYVHRLTFNSYPTKIYEETTTIDYANNSSTTTYTDNVGPGYGSKYLDVISNTPNAVTNISYLLEQRICLFDELRFGANSYHDVVSVNKLNYSSGTMLANVIIERKYYDPYDSSGKKFTIDKFVIGADCTDVVTPLF